MKNVESKFRVTDFGKIKVSLKKVKAKYVGKLNQLDTYYYCQKGRFKIREINNRLYELIHYQRPNKKSAKTSNYEVTNLNKEQAGKLKSILNISLGLKNIIKKTRDLYLYKHTRIYLDNVRDLGKFIELETVVKKIPCQKAKTEHKEITKILGLSKEKRISKSYCEIKQ